MNMSLVQLDPRRIAQNIARNKAHGLAEKEADKLCSHHGLAWLEIWIEHFNSHSYPEALHEALQQTCNANN